MFGIILLVCILIAFGFVYVWIANVVAREDVPIGKGVAIILIAGILSGLAGMLLAQPLGTILASLVQTVLNFGLLVGLTVLIAQLKPKQALIVAAIFTALMFILSLLFGLLLT